MRITHILALLGLFASACGGASVSTPAPKPDDGVAVGRAVCTKDGDTEVLTPVIRANRHGVRIFIMNKGDAIEFDIHVPGESGSHGGRLRGRITRSLASDAPGETEIMCRDKGEAYPSYEEDSRYAKFEIVDPKGLWVDFEPHCDDIVEAKRGFEQGTPVTQIETWVRDRFDIDEGERIRPGYPETGWKGDPWVIADDDTTFAYFHAFAQRRGGPLLAEAEGC